MRFRFVFEITMPNRTFKTSTIRETDNVAAAMKEFEFLYPDATSIKLIKHYKENYA